MLYSIRGNYILRDQNCAVVECSGLGYRVQTTMNTLKTLKMNSEVTLFTYMNVREDAVELFGFSTQNELSTFKMLISINGVGPKAALAILSELTYEQLAMAVVSSDAKSITRAQGVGPKLAQRIILELKDKIKGLSVSQNGTEITQGSVISDTGNISKAVAALAVLGFSAAEVSGVLSTLDPSLSVEEMIATTLKRMGR